MLLPRRDKMHSLCPRRHDIIALVAPVRCKFNITTSSRLYIQPPYRSTLFENMSSTSASGLTALSSTLLGLSTLAIGLRFYARRVQKVPLKMDDWINIPCLVSATSRADVQPLRLLLMKSFTTSRYSSLARQRQRCMVLCLHDQGSIKSRCIPYSSVSTRCQ